METSYFLSFYYRATTEDLLRNFMSKCVVLLVRVGIYFKVNYIFGCS